jgi:putative transposase
VPATGIDYLGLIDARHTAELAGKVNYSALAPEPAAPEQATEPAADGPEQP